MDDISEVVYVADLETHELLYLNDSGKRLAGVEDIASQTCHAVLQRLDAPCAFCTNDRLSYDDIYTWEHVNSITNHRYLLKDRLIDWEGRPARLEVALDMTASGTSEDDLRKALDAEGMVLQCARDLYGASDLEEATHRMLDSLGKYLAADRMRFFRLRDGRVSATFEWRADGRTQQVAVRQDLDGALVERWRRLFGRGKCVIIEDVASLPAECADERAFLERRRVSSLAAVPLERQGSVVGFLCIENPASSLVRNIASPLKTLCYFFMSTVARIENERRLTSLSFHDDLTGLYNRNRYLSDVEALKRDGGSLGILFLDVNDLKVVNDRYGHDRGDELLRFCAAQMRGALEGANLYRIGGDEFVALAPGVDEARFERMAADLDDAFAEACVEGRFGLGSAERFVSMGAQWAENPSDVPALLLAADAQMYERKRTFHLDKALAGMTPAAPDATTSATFMPSIGESALLRDYNMLMSALHVSVSKHLMTEKFEVVWANDFYYEMTGYTREEYVTLFNNNCADYFADFPDVFEELSATVMGAVAAGEPGYECLLQMPVKGGSRLWIRVVGLFTSEKVDGVPVIYATFTGVNDVVQMEQERSVTYDNLPGFVARYRVGADGLHLTWGNERFTEFFGIVGADEANRLFDLNVKANERAINSRFADFRAGRPTSFEIEAIGRDDRKAYFTIVGDCIDWVDGDPVYLVLYLDTTEVTEQRRLTDEANERLRRLAFVDEVTKGRNRTSFELDAGAAVKAAPANAYALVSLDIQKFKVVNDQFGIENGNRVLAYVHDRLASCLDEGEYVARVSADLFSLLVKAGPHDVLEERLEDLAHAVNDDLDLGGRTYLLTMTAGVYVIDEPDLPMMQLQDRANVARKKIGRSAAGGRLCACRFYSDEDRLRLAEEKELENRMRVALDAGEFVIFLQPKLELRTNAIVGAEALVRWADPVRGLVPPNDFIPLFERNGFVVDLDLNVFEQVCALLRAWADAGLQPVPLSVNLSRAHLADPSFVERYEEIRRRYEVPAPLIEIELTETLVFEDPERLARVIDALHAAGYRCSLDDFGSGYSSLNVLKDIDVDTLKLDGVFFDAPDFSQGRGADIIDIVIELSRRLGMRTVAEGVETEEQAAFLKRAGCDMIQGYLFSRPIPPAAFERLVFGQGCQGGDGRATGFGERK